MPESVRHARSSLVLRPALLLVAITLLPALFLACTSSGDAGTSADDGSCWSDSYLGCQDDNVYRLYPCDDYEPELVEVCTNQYSMGYRGSCESGTCIFGCADPQQPYSYCASNTVVYVHYCGEVTNTVCGSSEECQVTNGWADCEDCSGSHTQCHDGDVYSVDGCGNMTLEEACEEGYECRSNYLYYGNDECVDERLCHFSIDFNENLCTDVSRVTYDVETYYGETAVMYWSDTVSYGGEYLIGGSVYITATWVNYSWGGAEAVIDEVHTVYCPDGGSAQYYDESCTSWQ